MKCNVKKVTQETHTVVLGNFFAIGRDQMTHLTKQFYWSILNPLHIIQFARVLKGLFTELTVQYAITAVTHVKHK